MGGSTDLSVGEVHHILTTQECLLCCRETSWSLKVSEDEEGGGSAQKTVHIYDEGISQSWTWTPAGTPAKLVMMNIIQLLILQIRS